MPQNNSGQLYFIAIVPNDELEEKIRNIKLDIKRNYDSSKALKLPAHITLQIPFRLNEEKEEVLVRILQKIAEKENISKVHLSGYGKFSNHTIFINVINPEPVNSMHHKIQEALKANFILGEMEKTSNFHPHITVATRDLKKQNFFKAWAQFKMRKFEATFSAEKFILFRHNGKNWEVLEEFILANPKQYQ
ncbi:2'-5' RNA ligase family protein [Autumnicola musiva]|uniref:2'-5' RNA ligase family protein n=1 Tax=Autumnicola musiva TaxID=3075589 RepID=A0ABU3D3F5_9FLAO|nr:2'-5' RNA ligase family protein [Zunongwangia sp. F117]MDT0676066.1 2'-5' RNA ligase family protein [Zunongwangia sp. F117]